MGADYYVRASGRALFTLEKPSGRNAIGVDSLPESVRLSVYLTGNDLGRLGGLETRPTAIEIENFKRSARFRKISVNKSGAIHKVIEESHKVAHSLIADNLIFEALLLLLAADSLLMADGV
jgi:hypothetical protein